MVMDFDKLELGEERFDAIYAFESIGYSKDIDAWLERCWRMLKPGGRLLIRSPGSLDFCRREADYQSVTAFFENWRYNFLGANVLVFKLRRLGFGPIRYRHLPFWAWGLTWNFLQHLFLWKYRLRMRTMVDLEKIIWRTSKAFVFGNGYNIVLATKPTTPPAPVQEWCAPRFAETPCTADMVEEGDDEDADNSFGRRGFGPRWADVAPAQARRGIAPVAR